jgi:hypothetical protein
MRIVTAVRDDASSSDLFFENFSSDGVLGDQAAEDCLHHRSEPSPHADGPVCLSYSQVLMPRWKQCTSIRNERNETDIRVTGSAD